MAEILIKLEEARNPDDPTAWGKHHPVAVKPDGWKWGAKETLPKFCVVRIADMTVEEAEKYLEEETQMVDDGKVVAPVVTRIRKYTIAMDDPALAKSITTEIAEKGFVSVTKTEILTAIKDTAESAEAESVR